MDAVLEPLFKCLFFSAPAWGTLGAWLYVRLMNRLCRKLRPECCLTCGYNLTGNVSGVCPECGTPIDKP